LCRRAKNGGSIERAQGRRGGTETALLFVPGDPERATLALRRVDFRAGLGYTAFAEEPRVAPSATSGESCQEAQDDDR